MKILKLYKQNISVVRSENMQKFILNTLHILSSFMYYGILQGLHYTKARGLLLKTTTGCHKLSANTLKRLKLQKSFSRNFLEKIHELHRAYLFNSATISLGYVS
uniref:Uncharacterized protein n=1 Tax=Glossina austeni TaxID=7395 RepID=A0A1A9VUD0_GLOAU